MFTVKGINQGSVAGAVITTWPTERSDWLHLGSTVNSQLMSPVTAAHNEPNYWGCLQREGVNGSSCHIRIKSTLSVYVSSKVDVHIP